MRSIYGDQYALFFITLWVLWTCFFIFNVVLFFKKKKSIYIKCRAPLLIFCSALGQYCMMTSLSWKIILLPSNFPNMVDLWFVWLFIPLHLLPYPIRALRFIIQYNVNNYDYEVYLQQKQGEGAPPIPGFRGKTRKLWKWLSAHPKWRSDKAFFIFNWILMAIAIANGIYRNITHPENKPGQYGGQNTQLYYIACTILLAVVSFFVWVAVAILCQIQDELYYNVELTTIGILWAIFITLYIIFGWAKVGIFQLQAIMAIILCLASFLVSFGMPVQLSIVTKKEVFLGSKILDRLELLLKDKEASEVFHEFTVKKMCPESFLFYQAVESFRNESDTEIQQKLFDEIKITYIEQNSANQINISTDQRKKIMETETASHDVFNVAFDENYKILQTEIFREFKISAFAKDYAKKLRAKAGVGVEP